MEADGFTLVVSKKKRRNGKKQARTATNCRAGKSTQFSAPHRQKRKASTNKFAPFKYECSAKQTRRRQRDHDGEVCESAQLSKIQRMQATVGNSAFANTLWKVTRLVLQRPQNHDAVMKSKSIHLTVYGVGNITDNSVGCFQLGAVLWLRGQLSAFLSDMAQGTPTTEEQTESASTSKGEPRVELSFYDPVTTEHEATFLEKEFGFKILHDNEGAKRKLDSEGMCITLCSWASKTC